MKKSTREQFFYYILTVFDCAYFSLRYRGDRSEGRSEMIKQLNCARF